MKLLKAIIITLISLLLTGCYTQLQYSQTMKKVTDKKQTSDTPGYSWNGEEKAESSRDKTNEDVAKAENNQEERRDYIPVYYKDYEYATKYGNVYNFYGNDWYGHRTYPYSRYNSFYSWHPFSYDRWTYHSLYGRWYDRPHYGISVTLNWGWPSYHYGYYDPFYRPYYDYYWHRYYSRYAYGYGYWNFYGKSGFGHGYYPDEKVREGNNIRYSPRSIGTNRVVTDGNRSRTVDRNRSAAVTNRTSSTVRTRSVGTTRTRDTSGRSSVNRAKDRDNSSSSRSSRSRTRGQDQIDNSRLDRYDYRSNSDEIPLVIDEKQLEQIRARISNDRKSIINRSQLNSNRDDRTTFFNRMKNFFEQNTSSFSNGNNGRTLRTRSSFPSTNRSALNRSSSSNNRSSVTRSKSSSSNSRSRGSGSSSSRSRSDSGSSSSSERSRGN
ncbi:hypothetical protein [Fodinibius sp. AD559]|uniref:hypothetical protein n=1 Tax=Fodinibius sp. AD559 TaxID=3424179 RepID=UPI004046998E